MKRLLILLLLFIGIQVIAQEQANFIYTKGKTFVIKSYDEALEVENFYEIDFSHLRGFFNSTNYNIAYKHPQIQLSPNSDKVFFKLQGIKDRKFTQFFYCYDIQTEQFDTIMDLQNDLIDWWQSYPDLGFIIAYTENAQNLLYIDLETGEHFPFEEFEHPFKFITTEVNDKNIVLRGRQNDEYIEYSYNTLNDHIHKDTLFHLELANSTLMYHPPFLIETDVKDQLFVLHNMHMKTEQHIPFNGKKIHHDQYRRKFLIPSEEKMYYVDYNLNIQDSLPISNATVFMETADTYLIKEHSFKTKKDSTTHSYVVSKDFKKNELLETILIDEHLTSVQYTRLPIGKQLTN